LLNINGLIKLDKRCFLWLWIIGGFGAF